MDDEFVVRLFSQIATKCCRYPCDVTFQAPFPELQAHMTHATITGSVRGNGKGFDIRILPGLPTSESWENLAHECSHVRCKHVSLVPPDIEAVTMLDAALRAGNLHKVFIAYGVCTSEADAAAMADKLEEDDMLREAEANRIAKVILARWSTGDFECAKL